MSMINVTLKFEFDLASPPCDNCVRPNVTGAAKDISVAWLGTPQLTILLFECFSMENDESLTF